MKHYGWSTGLACLILAGSAIARDLSHLESQIHYADGVIVFDVSNALASDVVKVIGAKIDVDVTVHGTIETRLTGNYTDKSIERLLEKMNLQYVLVWDAKDKNRTLQEIVLLSEGASQSEFLSDAVVDSAAASPDTAGSQMLDNMHDENNDIKTGALNNAAEATVNGFNFSFDPASVLK